MKEIILERGRGELVWRFIAPALAVLVCTSFVLYNIFFSKGDADQKKRLPPGPKGLPILGSILSFTMLPHQYFAKLAAQYGPITFLYVGSVPTVVISSPDTAKEILKTQDHIWASRPSQKVFETFAYGRKDIVVAPHGPDWRLARKIGTLELFSPQRIAKFQGLRRLEYLFALKGVLEASREGIPVDMKPMLLVMFMNLVTQMMWRKRHFLPQSQTSPEASAFQKIVREMVTLVGVLNISDYIPSMTSIMSSMDFQGYHKRIRTVHSKFDAFVESVILEHRKDKSKIESGEKADSNVVEDFVDVLLRLAKEAEGSGGNEEISIDMVKAILFDLIIAGTETPSTSVEWVMTELVKKPETMKKLQEELDTVVGTDRLVTEDDIPNLKYLQAVCKEGLRIHPPTPFLIPHQSTHDSIVSGYFVPAGTTAYVNAYGIQRDPSVWEKPMEFIPERFYGSNCNIDLKGQHFDFLSFGSGRRMCPATTLGFNYVQTAIAHLVHAFNWSLMNGQKAEDLDMSEALSLTCPKKVSLCVLPTPRLPIHVICP